jgi:hypothetical protein
MLNIRSTYVSIKISNDSCLSSVWRILRWSSRSLTSDSTTDEDARSMTDSNACESDLEDDLEAKRLFDILRWEFREWDSKVMNYWLFDRSNLIDDSDRELMQERQIECRCERKNQNLIKRFDKIATVRFWMMITSLIWRIRLISVSSPLISARGVVWLRQCTRRNGVGWTHTNPQ